MRRLIVLLAMIAATPAIAQDVSVAGELTRADFETYKEVPFAVPAGVERITVRLTYDKGDKTVVDLGLWDPARFRGWSGGTRDRFTVSPTDASPGYLSGPLPAGRWRIVLGVPNIRAGSRSRYRVDVWFDRGTQHAASTAIADPPLRTGPGWYRGDLHTHDAHSDGSCAPRGEAETPRIPCPLSRTVAAAAAAGLDFVAVTDHNTVSHFDGLRELQPWVAPLLLIPGTEVTTFRGHANIFAPRRFVDFRLGSRKGIRALQDEAADAGAILSINHPALPSGELCMGCGWTWPDTDWSRVAAIEVVNGPRADGPLAGTAFWFAQLDAGHRITGIAGSDNHDPDAPTGQSPIGRPATVVRATGLSTPSILQGIRGGNVFIDVEGSRDRLLDVEATQDGGVAVMGGTLSTRGAIDLKVRVQGVPDASVKVVGRGGIVLMRRPVSRTDEALEFRIADGAAKTWVAVIVERGGHPLLIGNPIYLR
jgi:hypothetical protein